MKKAVITGATGFLGSALTKQCLENDIHVYAIVRKNSKHLGNLSKHKNLDVIQCDRDEWKKFVPCVNDCDVFYHFAWETEKSTHDDLPLQVHNIRYALDAVELAKRFGCHTFIGAGSQAEYGRVEGDLKPETPTFPENGYGIAKLCAGQMTRVRAEQLGLRHIWTRILSVYGPNDGAQSMISSAIAKLLRGEHMPFTKGEQLWDYLYIEDAAEAFRLIGEKGKNGKTYVLGSGDARPLSEYIRIIAKTCGAENGADLGAIPYAEKQVMYLKADISELQKDTGWKPKTSFKEGIKVTIEKFGC